MEEEEEESLWSHIDDFLSYATKGFVKGFTTLSIGDDEPQQSYEQLAYSMGNLFGFLGIIPGLGPIASVGTRTAVAAVKGAVSSTRFAWSLGNNVRKAAAAKELGRKAVSRRIEGKALGQIKGLDKSTKGHVDKFMSRWANGDLRKSGEKYFRLIKDDLGKYPTFRSVPFYLSELSQNAILNGIARNEALAGPSHILRPGLPHVDTVLQGWRIGSAFAISSWQEGADAMAQSFLMGSLLGGFDKVVVNAPWLRPALKMNASGDPRMRFRDLSVVFKGGTGEQKLEAQKMAARAMAGGLLNLGTSWGFGDPTELQIYNFLLGAWFGGKEVSMSQERAMRFIQRAKRTPGVLHRIEETPEWTGGKDAFGRDTIPFDNETKAEILRWQKQRMGDVGQALAILAGAAQRQREDMWEKLLRGEGFDDKLREDLVMKKGLVRDEAIDRMLQKAKDEGREVNEEDLYETIFQDAVEEAGLPQDVVKALEGYATAPTEKQRAMLEEVFSKRAETRGKKYVGARGLDLLSMDESDVDMNMRAYVARQMQDMWDLGKGEGISIETLAQLSIDVGRAGGRKLDAIEAFDMVQHIHAEIKKLRPVYAEHKKTVFRSMEFAEGEKQFPNLLDEAMDSIVTRLFADEMPEELPVREIAKMRNKILGLVQEQPVKQIGGVSREARREASKKMGRTSEEKAQDQGLTRQEKKNVEEADGESGMTREEEYEAQRIEDETRAREDDQAREKDLDQIEESAKEGKKENRAMELADAFLTVVQRGGGENVKTDAPPFRVLVTGGRDFKNKQQVWDELDKIKPDILISGGAKGADSLAEQWAKARGVVIERYDPDWKKEGKKAAFLRNQRMVDEGKPHMLVAFKGGKGTEHQVNITRKAKIPVHIAGQKLKAIPRPAANVVKQYRLREITVADLRETMRELKKEYNNEGGALVTKKRRLSMINHHYQSLLTRHGYGARIDKETGKPPSLYGTWELGRKEWNALADEVLGLGRHQEREIAAKKKKEEQKKKEEERQAKKRQQVMVEYNKLRAAYPRMKLIDRATGEEVDKSIAYEKFDLFFKEALDEAVRQFRIDTESANPKDRRWTRWHGKQREKTLDDIWQAMLKKHLENAQYTLDTGDVYQRELYRAWEKVVELRTMTREELEKNYANYQYRRKMGEKKKGDHVITDIAPVYEITKSGDIKQRTKRITDFEQSIINIMNDVGTRPNWERYWERPVEVLVGNQLPGGSIQAFSRLTWKDFDYVKRREHWSVVREYQEMLFGKQKLLVSGNNDVDYGHVVPNPWRTPADAGAFIAGEMGTIYDRWENVEIAEEGTVMRDGKIVSKRDFTEAEYFAALTDAAYRLHLGQPLMEKPYFDEIDIAHIGWQIAYQKEANGMTLPRLLEGMEKGYILKNERQVNKRWKIVNNGFMELGAWLDASKVKGISDEQKKGRYMNVVLVKDDQFSHADGTDPDLVAEVNTDGVGRLRQDWLEQIREQGGFDDNAGFFKPFIVHKGEKKDGQSLGMLLGKMAWHAQTPAMSREMERQGIDLILSETAVKQSGFRDFQVMKKVGDKLVFDGGEPVKYKVSLDSMTMDMNNYDKAKSHFGGNVRMGVQMIKNMTHRDRKAIDAIMERITGEGSEWAGTQKVNEKAMMLLSAIEKGDEGWREMEEQVIGEIDMEQLGKPELTQIINMNASFPTRLFDKAMRFVLSEAEARDTGSEMIQELETDPQEFLKKMHEAALSHKKSKDLVIKTAVERGLITPMDFIATPLRNYLESILHSHVMDAISKPRIKNAWKAILSTSGDFEGRTERGFFRLTRGYRERPIKYGNQPDARLGPAYDHFIESGGWEKAEEWQKEAMTMALMRAPQTTMSGVRSLKFGGFIDTDGYGVQTHEKDMLYLGGADKDIDYATVYQDLPREYMDMVKGYEDQFFDKKKGEFIDDKMMTPLFTKPETYGVEWGKAAAFDAEKIVTAGIRANLGKMGVSTGLYDSNNTIPYVEEFLMKEFKPGDTIGMDTVKSGKYISTRFDTKRGTFFWTGKLRENPVHDQYKGLIAVTRQYVSIAVDSADFGEIVDGEGFSKIKWESMMEDGSIKYWKAEKGGKITQISVDDLPPGHADKLPFEDSRMNDIENLLRAFKGKYKAYRYKLDEDKDAPPENAIVVNLKLGINEGRDYVMRHMRRLYFPGTEPVSPGLRLLRKIEDVSPSQGKFWKATDAHLPYRNDPLVTWGPQGAGPMFSRVFDVIDRVAGTGSRGRSKRDKTPYISPDVNFTDLVLSFLNRFRLSVATAAVRERQGLEALNIKEEVKRWENYKKEWKDQPEVINWKTREDHAGRYFQDMSDAITLKTLWGESMNIMKKATYRDYQRWHKNNVDQNYEEGVVLTPEQQMTALLKEVTRQRQEVQQLVKIRSDIMGKGAAMDVPLAKVLDEFEPAMIHLHWDHRTDTRQMKARDKSKVGKEWRKMVNDATDEGPLTRPETLALFNQLAQRVVRQSGGIFARFRQLSFLGSITPQELHLDYDSKFLKTKDVARKTRNAYESARNEMMKVKRSGEKVPFEMKDEVSELKFEMEEAGREHRQSLNDWYDTNFSAWRMDEQFVDRSVIQEWTDTMNELWLAQNFDITEGQIRSWLNGMRLDKMSDQLLQPNTRSEAIERQPSQFAIYVEQNARSWAAGRLSDRKETESLNELDRRIAEKNRFMQAVRRMKKGSNKKNIETIESNINHEISLLMDEAESIARQGLGHYLLDNQLGRRVSFAVAGEKFRTGYNKGVLNNIAEMAGEANIQEAIRVRSDLTSLRKNLDEFAAGKPSYWDKEFEAMEKERNQIVDDLGSRIPLEIRRQLSGMKDIDKDTIDQIAEEVNNFQKSKGELTDKDKQEIYSLLVGEKKIPVSALLMSTEIDPLSGKRLERDPVTHILRGVAEKIGVPVYDMSQRSERKMVEGFLKKYREMHGIEPWKEEQKAEDAFIEQQIRAEERGQLISEDLDKRYKRLKMEGMLGDKPIEYWTTRELDNMIILMALDNQTSHDLFYSLVEAKLDRYAKEIDRQKEIAKSVKEYADRKEEIRDKKNLKEIESTLEQQLQNMLTKRDQLLEEVEGTRLMEEQRREETESDERDVEYKKAIEDRAKAAIAEIDSLRRAIDRKKRIYAEEDRRIELLDPEQREMMTFIRGFVEKNPGMGKILNKLFLGTLNKLSRGVGTPSLQMATKDDIKRFVDYLKNIDNWKFVPEYQNMHNYMFPEDVSTWLAKQGEVNFEESISIVNDVVSKNVSNTDYFKTNVVEPTNVMDQVRRAMIWSRQTSTARTQEVHEEWGRMMKEFGEAIDSSIFEKPLKTEKLGIDIAENNRDDYIAMIFRLAHHRRLINMQERNIKRAIKESTPEHWEKTKKSMEDVLEYFKNMARKDWAIVKEKGWDKLEVMWRRGKKGKKKARKTNEMIAEAIHLENKMIKKFYRPNEGAGLLEYMGNSEIVSLPKTFKKIQLTAIRERQMPRMGARTVKKIVSEYLIQNHEVVREDGTTVLFKELPYEEQKRMRNILLNDPEIRGKFSTRVELLNGEEQMTDFFPLFGYSKNDMNDHMYAMWKNQQQHLDTFGEHSNVMRMIQSAADTIFNPDYNQVATRSLYEAGLVYNPLYGNHVARYLRPLFGYDMLDSAFPNWLESVHVGLNRQIAALIGHKAVNDYVRRRRIKLKREGDGSAMPERAIDVYVGGRDTKTETKEWDKVMYWADIARTYIARVTGANSYTPNSMMYNPAHKMDKLYSWLTDRPWMERSQEPARRANDIAVMAEAFARYDLVTLLAHPKVWVGNIAGGTLNNAISVGGKYMLKTLPTKKNMAELEKIFPEMKKKKYLNSKWNYLVEWSQRHGVQDAMQTQELGTEGTLAAKLRKDFVKLRKEARGELKWADYLEHVLRKRYVEKGVRRMAWFIQHSEKTLRTMSFLTHYLKFRDMFLKQGLKPGVNDPYLIELANKGVAMTQFNYDNIDRPFVAQTNLGKVFYRYKLWVGNSLRMFHRVWKDAKLVDWEPGTDQMEMLERYMLSIMFANALAHIFPYSILNSSLPAPADQMMELSAMVFGEEDDKDDSFYGYGRFGLGGSLWSQVRPSITRPLDAVFYSLATGEWERLADYHLWTWLPMGRMVRTATQMAAGEVSLIEGLTGFPDELYGYTYDALKEHMAQEKKKTPPSEDEGALF